MTEQQRWYLFSEEKAKILNIKPMGYWLGGALSSVDPQIMGLDLLLQLKGA